jgi:hypothetical protein
VKRAALLVGLGAAIALAFGFAADPARALRSYLFAWTALVTLAVGALGWLVIAHATHARWAASVRGIAEVIAGALLPLAVLALPLGWHVGLRGAVYLAVWIGCAELVRRRPALAPALALPIALATTFAAREWLGWTSAAFGLQLLAGGLAGGLGLVIVAARLAHRPIAGHALARVLLVLVATWGYLMFIQALIIQIADRPDEIGFFALRARGPWRVVTALVVALRFALPLPLLVPRRWKDRSGFVAAVAAVLVLGHLVELYWLAIPPADPIPTWTDGAALVAIGGIAAAVALWRAR